MTHCERFMLKTAVELCLMAVAFLLGWMGGCDYEKQHAKTEYRIDTIRMKSDTIIVSSPVLTKEIPCFIPSEVDTTAVLAQFYAKRVYTDTLHLQDFGTVTLMDTVLMNGIGSRNFTYDLTFPVRKRKWSFGIGSFFHNGGAGAYGTVQYRHLQILGGYDFLNKSTLFGAQYMF